MINLRYHIVSITAVFLALGIGLTLGSTFLDRVTVDNLKSQLDTVQGRVDQTQAENERLQALVGSAGERDGEMIDELPERAFAGELADVPVLVIAAEGTNEELVSHATDVLVGAGADLAGTWWLTERWALDDDDEVADLGAALQLSTQDAERLRRNGAIHLADVLLASAGPAEVAEPPAGGDAVAPAQPVEPELAAQLEEQGFLDYTPVVGAGNDRVALPASGLRLVMVSATEPGSGPELMSVALIDEVTADGPAPLVVAQGAVSFETEAGAAASESDQRSTFVGPLREGELTRDRLSTIDTLDTTAGLVALVLAVEDAGALRHGHYGVADGATRLLPGTDPDT